MQRHLQKFIFLFFFLAWGCSARKNQETPFKTGNQSPYFISIPIIKFSPIQSPCVEVEIDGKKVSMELDLGYWGDLSVTKEIVDLFPHKSFIRKKLMYGIRGKQYPTNLYRIPKVKIGGMTFLNPTLQEGTLEFIKDSTFVQNGTSPSPRDPGRLGWEIFYKVNLLIDIKNSQIAFCDSLNTLKTNGYPVDTFTKIPLLIDRGLIEFEAETPEGLLRCMLDTGSTWNILNRETQKGEHIDKAAWDPNNISKCSSFKIGGKDFGPIHFHCLPIKVPIRIEAILGMEFFQDNLIFLDFTRGSIYLCKRN